MKNIVPKVLIGCLLTPLIIFAVGAVLVLGGGAFSSLFERDSGSPSPEPEATSAAGPKATKDQKTSAPTQITKPSVSYATVYYNVSGTTVEEIRASKASAARGTFLAGHDGATTAKTNINFKRRQLSGTCEAIMDRYTLALTYTYPRLTTLSQVSPGVAAQWNAFTAALKVHEEGHAKIEVERAGILLQELQKLPPYTTCEEFDKGWQAKANAFDEATKQLQAAYDRDTQSGRTQGVKF